MRYAQERGGQKLHYALEPGEEMPDGTVVRRGELGRPLCGRRVAGYRMTCNLPLAHACGNCRRVFNSRVAKGWRP